MARVFHFFVFVCAFLLLASPLLAQVYVTDDDLGGHSEDIFVSEDEMSEEPADAVEDGVDRAPSQVETAVRSDKKAEPVCSEQDLKSIKLFDEVLVKAQNEIKEIHEKINTVNSEDKVLDGTAEDLVNEIHEKTAIFTSDEYRMMRPLYKRCGKEMRSVMERPKWQPKLF